MPASRNLAHPARRIAHASAVAPGQEASYSAIIDKILSTADLQTISAKRIRKELQAQVEYDLTPQKVGFPHGPRRLSAILSFLSSLFLSCPFHSRCPFGIPALGFGLIYAPTCYLPHLPLRAFANHFLLFQPIQDAITKLILARFDYFTQADTPVEVVPPHSHHASAQPPEPINGVVKSVEKSPSDSAPSSPKKRATSDPDEEVDSDLSSVAGNTPPKKKQKKTRSIEEDDAAFAKRLQAEENMRARSTRGGGAGTKKRSAASSGGGVKAKAKTQKKKKAKSAKKVRSDDDSELEGEEGEEKEKAKKGGFHVSGFVFVGAGAGLFNLQMGAGWEDAYAVSVAPSHFAIAFSLLFILFPIQNPSTQLSSSSMPPFSHVPPPSSHPVIQSSKRELRS